jgi:hypothetical protein
MPDNQPGCTILALGRNGNLIQAWHVPVHEFEGIATDDDSGTFVDLRFRHNSTHVAQVPIRGALEIFLEDKNAR